MCFAVKCSWAASGKYCLSVTSSLLEAGLHCDAVDEMESGIEDSHVFEQKNLHTF